MPVSPHPITFTVKDTDASTALASANCIVRNVTKGTVTTATLTNASGIAIIDLANLPQAGTENEYDIGDVCLLISYMGRSIGDCHDAARYVVAGSSKSQTLNMNPFPLKALIAEGTSQRLYALFASNNASTTYYFKVYDYDNGHLIMHMNMPADNCKPISIYGNGISGRVVIERENAAIFVTGKFK